MSVKGNSISQKAEDYFRAGYGCTEALYKAFSESYGHESDSAQRIASMFQGGLCMQGLTCGTLIGGLMVIGENQSNAAPDQKEPRDQALASGTALVQWYREKQGATSCAGLLGLDLSVPEEAEQFGPGGYFDNVCTPLLAETCEWLLENVFSEVE